MGILPQAKTVTSCRFFGRIGLIGRECMMPLFFCNIFTVSNCGKTGLTTEKPRALARGSRSLGPTSYGAGTIHSSHVVAAPAVRPGRVRRRGHRSDAHRGRHRPRRGCFRLRARLRASSRWVSWPPVALPCAAPSASSLPCAPSSCDGFLCAAPFHRALAPPTQRGFRLLLRLGFFRLLRFLRHDDLSSSLSD